MNSSVRVGVIVAVDLTTYRAKVKLVPSGVTTGWLRLGSEYVGAGWGFYAAPSLGDQVLVAARNGNFSDATVISRVFDAVNFATPTPPLEQGEIRMSHSTGSYLRFMASGHVDLVADTQLNLTAPNLVFQGDSVFAGDLLIFGGDLSVSAFGGNGGDVTVSGNATVGGNVAATGSVTGSNIP